MQGYGHETNHLDDSLYDAGRSPRAMYGTAVFLIIMAVALAVGFAARGEHVVHDAGDPTTFPPTF